MEYIKITKDSSLEEAERAMYYYKKSRDELCIYKGEVIFMLYIDAAINKPEKLLSRPYPYVYMIIKDDILVAVAEVFINHNDKVINVAHLCSNINHKIKNIGYTMLDYIVYNNKVFLYFDKYLLKIELAMPGLAKYYSDWLTPDLITDKIFYFYGDVLTNNYGNLGLRDLKQLCEYLHVPYDIIKDLDIEYIKKIFYRKLQLYEKEKDYSAQMIDDLNSMIDRLKYTEKDYKNMVMNNRIDPSKTNIQYKIDKSTHIWRQIYPPIKPFYE